MTPYNSAVPCAKLTPSQWLICVIAAIGFAFDIYELLMLPLIVAAGAAASWWTSTPGTPEFNHWVGLLFWIPAIAGGIFGLLGGYLTDRLGRRRVLTWSILLYAFSAFAAGFSTNIWQFLFFRCTTFIGVCVEFVAAVAWLAELFPDPKQREKRARLHAGVLVGRRPAGDRRQLPGCVDQRARRCRRSTAGTTRGATR